ncbi:uncharacterized protein LOC132785122 [Drosophila nasuta]|uniref:uncharacterized protein LOC132785122 n=1 Tax=Drosophila nasuta TaxID=42062 RepID=UPI00295F0674|nr:uncharacterized protein LOC132785122 [Drosophila nasuta]
MWLSRVVLVLFDDDEIFSDCRDQPDGVLNINGMWDFTELTIESQSDQIKVSGNTTSVWDIQLADRVVGSIDVYKFYRREWVPTIYKINVPDVCSSMYDKNQYWYSLWTQYITNADDIKDKCINVRGIKYIYRPFILKDLQFNNQMTTVEGPHKVQIQLKAFDEFGKLRPTSICFELKAYFETKFI